MAEQTQEQTQELSEQIEESLSNRRDDSNVYIASQWQLMWWRLRRHKLAMASLIILAGFYFISAFAEFFAYTHPLWADADIAEIPIQQVQWFDGLKFDHFFKVWQRPIPRFGSDGLSFLLRPNLLRICGRGSSP